MAQIKTAFSPWQVYLLFSSRSFCGCHFWPLLLEQKCRRRRHRQSLRPTRSYRISSRSPDRSRYTRPRRPRNEFLFDSRLRNQGRSHRYLQLVHSRQNHRRHHKRLLILKISLNLFTIGFHLVSNGQVPRLFLCPKLPTATNPTTPTTNNSHLHGCSSRGS